MFQSILAALSAGHAVPDDDFDLVYSEPMRALSGRNWTPVEVAYVAAKLLVRDADTKVLDVGSGVGKFCQIGAAVTPGTFVGVERRRPYVDEARRTTALLGVERLRFVHANMEEVDWREFSAFYLFNPFLDQIDGETQLSRDVDRSAENHAQYVRAVQERLAAMPIGTRVVTYHGFGGLVPPQYHGFFSHHHDGDYLRAWLKTD